MYVYAGIDEAGYGPMFGPLLVGRAVLTIPRLEAGAPPPRLWQRLSKAVCRSPRDRKGRIAVDDSKKLHTSAAGVRHLEIGTLAFAGLAGIRPTGLADWFERLTRPATLCAREACGEPPPWYGPSRDRPWPPLPVANTAGQVAVARGLLTSTARRIGVEGADLGAAVVFEDQFNRMVAATRSKAATSFTFVARHLAHIWRCFGEHDPMVVVDRQSGRTRYRELLACNFPGASIRILEESPRRSLYHLTQMESGGTAKVGDPKDAPVSQESEGAPRPRAMRVSFEVEADRSHMPVALASMLSKYTRELLMARFNAFFTGRVPSIRPTAGYAADAHRFRREIEPHLPGMHLSIDQLRRRC